MDFQTRPLLRGSDPLVVVATPCYGGMVTQNYMISVLRLMEYCATASFRATAALLGNDSSISRSRSTLLSVFLDHGEATHLLFIDADIAFEPQQIARMMAFDRDFVAALYPVKLLDWARLPPNHEINGGNPAEPLMHYVGTLCEAPDLAIENGFATALYAGGGFQLEDSGEAARLFRDDGAQDSGMMPPGSAAHAGRWFCGTELMRRQSSYRGNRTFGCGGCCGDVGNAVALGRAPWRGVGAVQPLCSPAG
jgi:hypothetical protein